MHHIYRHDVIIDMMQQGVFVTGPENLTDPDTPVTVQRVYVSVADKTEELYLIIYRVSTSGKDGDSWWDDSIDDVRAWCAHKHTCVYMHTPHHTTPHHTTPHHTTPHHTTPYHSTPYQTYHTKIHTYTLHNDHNIHQFLRYCFCLIQNRLPFMCTLLLLIFGLILAE